MKISVILPVYNSEPYLAECLDSVLAQTLPDFEILAINDGSVDKSGEILNAYAEKDTRIKVRHFNRNYGEPRAVQHAWREAQGEYLARMDNDDICLPERFAAQVNYLDTHPDIAVLGANIEAFGSKQGGSNVPLDDATIKANFIVARANILNPTAMWRRAWFAEKDIFYGNLKNVSDYGLWVDCMLAGGTFANLPSVLLKYRTHSEQASNDLKVTNDGVQLIMEKLIIQLFPQLNMQQSADLAAICHGAGSRSLKHSTVMQAMAAYEVVKNDMQSRFGENRQAVFANIAQRVQVWQNAITQVSHNPPI